MKKLLALVLALVMTLGLATVGANAAYKDADSINYKEAVDVMSAIGVLAGDETGFRPADTLKRSEGAKIVAYLMLGNKTAEAIQASGTKYTDLPANHWAAGYMEYLTSAGVMGGVGDGKIDPDGQLTATAFAKMLLTALGYDAKIEGLVGSDWSINTQKLANDNDLFDGLDILGSAALTREQAAQMCLNDLKADMVEYESKGTTVSVGDAKVTTDAKKATEKVEKGSNNYNNAAIGTSDRNYRQLAEELYGNDLKFASTSDDLGRSANKWTYKNSDVGTYASKSDCLYSEFAKPKRSAMYTLIGKDAYDNLVDGTDLLTVYVNGVATKITGEANIKLYFDKNNASDDATGTSNGTLYEVYRVEDGVGTNRDQYTIVAANTYLVQATANYSASTEKLKVKFVDDTGTTKPGSFPTLEIDSDDFALVADAKEDDYFVVTYSADTKDFQTVEKANTVTGKVTTYKYNDSVTLDGTKYSYNAFVGSDSTHGKLIDYSIGNEVKLVTDARGYIMLVEDADYSSTYVYVDKFATTGVAKDAEASAYFTDGTYKTITVKKVTYNNAGARAETTSATTIGGWGNVRTWYTYTVDSNGRYTLKQVDATIVKNTDYTQGAQNTNHTLNDGGKTVLTKDVVNFINGATTVKGNADTIVFVLDDDDDVTVYSGIANVPGITIASTTANGNVYVKYTVKDNFAKYVFVDASAIKTSVDDDSTSDDYMFVLKKSTKSTYVATDDSYCTIDVYRNGAVEKDVKVNADDIGNFAVGNVYNKIKTNSKGYLTGGTLLDDASASKAVATGVSSATFPIGFDKDTITLTNGTKSATVSYVLNGNVILGYAENTDILNDKGADYELDTVGGSTLKSNLEDYSYTYNYFAVLHDDNSSKIDELYVWISAATGTGTTSSTTSTTLSNYAVDLRAPSKVKFYSNEAVSNTEAANAVAAELEANGWVLTEEPTFSTNYVFKAKKPSDAFTTTFTLATGDILQGANAAAAVLFTIDGVTYGMPATANDADFEDVFKAYDGLAATLGCYAAVGTVRYHAANTSTWSYGTIGAGTNNINSVDIADGTIIETGYVEVQVGGSKNVGAGVVDTSKLTNYSTAWYTLATTTYNSIKPAAVTTGTGILVNTGTYLPYSATMADVDTADAAADNGVADIAATSQIKVTVYDATLNDAGTAVKSNAVVATYASGYNAVVRDVYEATGLTAATYGTHVHYGVEAAGTYTAFTTDSTAKALADTTVYVGYVEVGTLDPAASGTINVSGVVTWSAAIGGTVVPVGTKLTATVTITSGATNWTGGTLTASKASSYAITANLTDGSGDAISDYTITANSIAPGTTAFTAGTITVVFTLGKVTGTNATPTLTWA